MGGLWSYQGEEEDNYSDDSSVFDDSENDISESSSSPIEDVLDGDTCYQCTYGFPDSNICLDSATDTVDAVPQITMPITLKPDQVMMVEDQLDLYEKVSLVYLLYDDPKWASEELSKLVDGGKDKLVYNWAIHQNLSGQMWQGKLIEALCIIQNYQVLTSFGFIRKDLDLRFLPHHSFTSLYINKIRKALYFICEDFVRSDVDQLLELACPDFQRKGLKFKIYNKQHLELYFLHWESIGYIKQDDLSNLCSMLKQMDQLDLCDKLKDLVPVVIPPNSHPMTISKTVDSVENKKSKNIFDQILNPGSSLQELASLDCPISADNAAHVSSDNKYHIDPKNPGVCLIINQENFYREIDKKFQHLLSPSETSLEPRIGTSQDKEKLEATFKKFGFKTITRDNLIHSDIVKTIEEVILDITKESSLFICIMSHGNEGVVYGVNSCHVPVKTIKSLMCKKNRQNLLGKPKVLILQSCQGTTCQKLSPNDDDDDMTTDGPSSPPLGSVPPTADVFTFWATVPGYGAIRNKKTGSWFIQTLCNKMNELWKIQHFDDICTTVIGEVSSKTWNQVKDQVAMVPLKDSTFRKLFYLPPVRY